MKTSNSKPETTTSIVLPETKKKKEMAPETYARIGELVLQGKTRGQIAKILKEETGQDFSYTDVYMAVVRLQKANPGLKVSSKEENPHREEIFKLKAEGLKCKEIAEKLQLEYSQVYTTYIRDPNLK